jgi:predicted ribosome quality control (RQC) complex YloA/Tae2 family protein
MKEIFYESVHDECTYRIRAGETAQENWDLINDSSQNDVWFHVDGSPSCHVVVEVGDKKKGPHKSVINYCAQLCKEGSKLKANKNVKIIYTEIKNVKKSDKPGAVTTKCTKTVKI